MWFVFEISQQMMKFFFWNFKVFLVFTNLQSYYIVKPVFQPYAILDLLDDWINNNTSFSAALKMTKNTLFITTAVNDYLSMSSWL